MLVAVLRPGLRPDIHRWIACIGMVGSLAACGLVLLGLRGVRSGVAISVWQGGFVVDSFALFIAILACVTALMHLSDQRLGGAPHPRRARAPSTR